MSIRTMAPLLATAVLLLGCTAALAQSQVPVQIPPPAPPAPAPPPTAGGPNPLQGTWAWQHTDYGDGSSVASSDPSSYTVTFRPEGLAVIRADCNSGSAGFTVAGDSLTFQPAAVSLVACPPGSQDTVFLRDLSQVASFTVTGDQLALSFSGGTMLFSAVPPPSLTGVTWRVTGVNNGKQAVVSVLAGTQLTAVFGDDGRVSGDTGCNMYSGTYTVSGANLSFGPLATTRRACLSDAASAQEQAFLAALEATTTFEMNGAQLTLRDSGRATQATMVRPVN
ncbi:MAG TPA: META domain-containing protein [Chloroflexota bacterium]